jgi:hypothetical protein
VFFVFGKGSNNARRMLIPSLSNIKVIGVKNG